MSSATIMNQLVKDRRAWQADTIDEPHAWCHRLNVECLTALDDWIQQIAGDASAVTARQLPPAVRDACATGLEPAVTELYGGRGFVIIEQVPERYSIHQANALYWGVGQMLGRPVEQNVEGTLLYSVRDTGQSVAQGARFSVTNAESTFHTDGAFWDEIPDCIGLLCLATAKEGGDSQLISGYAIHNELFANHPEVLQTLYNDFYFDRRGGILPGESPVVRHPIFHWNRAELTMRYLDYYIHVAHEKANEPLTPEQQKALQTVDSLLKRPDLRVEFRLHPGQMLFTNNHWILHNRTGFVDHEEPELRRHYVRLWLQRKEDVAQ